MTLQRKVSCFIAKYNSRTFSSLSLNHTGYVYVPGACLNRTKCRVSLLNSGKRVFTLCQVHVSFHGCLQSFGVIGNTYMMRSGYIQWADTNRLIVLFPQTIISPFLPYNPKGCWCVLSIWQSLCSTLGSGIGGDTWISSTTLAMAANPV